jgi:hypothetical protein
MIRSGATPVVAAASIYNRATCAKDMREALERRADHIEAIIGGS